MKSIYDKVTKKIDVEFDAWDRAEHLELLELVEQALEKALKQEKLLKLYQKFVKDFDELSYEEVCDIEEKVKELENEMR